MNIEKLKEEQLKLAKKVILTDDFDKIETIGGVDFLYTDKEIICVIVVLNYKTKEIIEKKYTIEKVSFPYIPGFLSYRVASAAVKTFGKLTNKPEILMIAANGTLHPRKIGAASAIGLFLDKPTIGVAKNRLCGEEREDSIYLDKEVIGKKFITKDNAKPIYVSQGHKVSLTTTLQIIKEMLIWHKMPEPLYIAHKYGNKIREQISGKSATQEKSSKTQEKSEQNDEEKIEDKKEKIEDITEDKNEKTEEE